MATPLKRSQSPYVHSAPNYAPQKRGDNVVKHKFGQKKHRVIKRQPKENIFKRLLSGFIRFVVNIVFMGVVGYFVMPYLFTNFLEPMFLNRIANKHIKIDAKVFVDPTTNYISNATLFGANLVVAPAIKKKARNSASQTMSQIITRGENTHLKLQLNSIMSAYPHLVPSIYVWDYETGKSVEINSDKPVPTASMIKIPILFELFRQIEENEKLGNRSDLNINKAVVLDEIYRTEGSGQLQYGEFNRSVSLNTLANLMITDSDNSATNEILDEIGGKDGLNRAFRLWGMESSFIGDWLPDLKGQNKMSAKELATVLYNLDSPTFLNTHSKEYIKSYMGSVKNGTLLAAGLPKDATIYHKTGDIGKMLGDAGVVYSENGKKYIVAVMVQRPNNDYSARDFIQKVSKTIYEGLK